MTAKEKELKLFPDAYHVSEPTLGLPWSKIETVYTIFYTVLGEGSTEEKAWEDAAIQLEKSPCEK